MHSALCRPIAASIVSFGFIAITSPHDTYRAVRNAVFRMWRDVTSVEGVVQHPSRARTKLPQTLTNLTTSAVVMPVASHKPTRTAT